MYEDSVKVPLLVAGPEVARGHEVHTPVSLVDVAPTLLGAADIDGCGLAGESLLNIAAQGTDPTRTAFSEYHDGWSASASFMVRWDRWKLVHHVGFAPQLFDLQADPLETIDRAGEAALAGVLDEGRRRLLEIVDPAAVDAQAFRDQAAAIAAHGGEAAIRLRHDDFFDYTPLPGC